MEQDNYPAFERALNDMLSFYEALITNHKLWWKALCKHPLEEVQAAFDAHIADPEHGIHPPKPAHIIRHIERLFAKRGGCYKPYVPEPMPTPKPITPMIAPCFEALKLPNARYTPLYWKMCAEGFNKYGLRGPDLVRWALEHSVEEEAEVLPMTTEAN